MESTVGLFRCGDYDLEALLRLFRSSIPRVGFDISSVKGRTTLLKPNMLGAYPPEMGITSHPTFVEAAIIYFKELGAKVWVGDSANGIFPIDSVWERTGIRDVCRRHGVEEKVFERESGALNNGLFVAKAVLDAEVVINLPRFKTHGLTVLTIAAKNLYGCVPGMQKTKYHRDNIDRREFAKLVVRIGEIVRPALNIVDAITAMDGNGPSAGRIIKMDTVIIGQNHHTVDAVCADLVGLKPIHLDTLEAAAELGVWNSDDKIDVVGEKLDDRRCGSFELPKTYTKGWRDWWISLFVIDKIWSGLTIKPRIDRTRCQRCGLCVKACPVDAITAPEELKLEGPAPKVISKKCVQCYCCHEICPYKAIDLNESLGVRIGRFLGERRIKNR